MSIAIVPTIPRRLSLMLAIICLLSPARPSLSQIPEFSGAKVPTLAPLVREVTPS